MPEFPEVETTVRGLRKKVLKRTFIDVWTDDKIIKKPGFEQFKKEIKGKKINEIRRRGKNIIFELSDGHFLLTHLKMTGHFLYGDWDKNDKMNSFIHVKFFLDNNEILSLSDLRKFAKIELLSKEDLDQELERLGPELLEDGFTFEVFKNILKKEKGKIKQVLMDQEVFAGIGNIYSDEILWEAKVNPFRKIPDLSENNLKDIYSAIKIILAKALEMGGTSSSDYRNIEGKKGEFGSVLNVYRKEGENCPRCKTIIISQKIGGRSAHYCPVCQK